MRADGARPINDSRRCTSDAIENPAVSRGSAYANDPAASVPVGNRAYIRRRRRRHRARGLYRSMHFARRDFSRSFRLPIRISRTIEKSGPTATRPRTAGSYVRRKHCPSEFRTNFARNVSDKLYREIRRERGEGEKEREDARARNIHALPRRRRVLDEIRDLRFRTSIAPDRGSGGYRSGSRGRRAVPGDPAFT